MWAVSRLTLPLGRCRGTEGCRRYTVACRATKGHLVLTLQFLEDPNLFQIRSFDPAFLVAPCGCLVTRPGIALPASGGYRAVGGYRL